MNPFYLYKYKNGATIQLPITHLARHCRSRNDRTVARLLLMASIFVRVRVELPSSDLLKIENNTRSSGEKKRNRKKRESPYICTKTVE